MAAKLTQEQFIERATRVARGKDYDLSKVSYKGMKEKITVICNSHPTQVKFEIAPDNFLSGNGCPVCAKNSRRKKRIVSYGEFLRRASTAHQNKYIYGLNRDWSGIHGKAEIYCPEHGKFSQTAENHANGHGCGRCAERKRRRTHKSNFSTDWYTHKASSVHNGKYNYSISVYSSAKEKIQITCPDHGEFFQEAESHLQGSGCPLCTIGRSKKEQQIEKFLLSLGERVETRNRKLISPLEVDLYLPGKKVAIEYNGSYWHSSLKKHRLYHKEKADRAESKGIRLIQIPDFVYENKKDIVLRMLGSMVAGADSVGARKCRVLEISHKEASEFYIKHHLMGAVSGFIHVGLYLGKQLVACATFSRRSTGGRSVVNELSRYCTMPELSVHGGLSKITKFAMERCGVSEIITYVDRNWFSGKMYKKNGWELAGVSDPSYCYTNQTGTEYYHRAKFMKRKLKAFSNFSQTKTEEEIMIEAGFLKVWDSGHIKFRFGL